MSNKPRCIYNPMVKISTMVYGYNGGKELYEGPRQVLCTGMHHCNSCGWNPAVEAKRKEMELEDRRGYVWGPNEVRAEDYDFKGIVIHRKFRYDE